MYMYIYIMFVENFNVRLYVTSLLRGDMISH